MEFAKAVEVDLGDRVLNFDQSAAHAAASVAAQRRGAGRPVEVRDVQIAGIVASRRATLATRNVSHFNGLGLRVIDPWSAAGNG